MATVTELNERLQRIQQAKADRQGEFAEAYIKLLYDSVDGGDIDPDYAAEVLAAAERTPEEFEADCQTLEKRQNWVAEIAKLDEYNDTLLSVEEQLQDTLRERRAIMDKFQTKLLELDTQRGAALAAIGAIPRLRQNLNSTAWPWVTAEVAEIQRELAEKCGGIGTLQSHIETLKRNIASHQAYIDQHGDSKEKNRVHDCETRRTGIKKMRQQLKDTEKRLADLHKIQEPILARLSEAEAKKWVP